MSHRPALSGLTRTGSDTVRHMAQTYLASRGVQTTASDDALTTPDGRVFGLTNLASRCHNLTPDEWPNAITDQLGSLLDAYPGEPPALTPGQICEGAMLRLTPEGMMPEGWAKDYLHARVLGHGLIELLTYRHDNMVRWLRDIDVDLVGVDTVRTLAQANLELLPHTVEELEHNGRPLYRVEAGGFSASKMLLLDTLGPQITGISDDAGYLCIVASRFELIFTRATNDCIEQLPALQQLAFELFRDAHGPLSPRLHWWKNGRLI